MSMRSCALPWNTITKPMPMAAHAKNYRLTRVLPLERGSEDSKREVSGTGRKKLPEKTKGTEGYGAVKSCSVRRAARIGLHFGQDGSADFPFKRRNTSNVFRSGMRSKARAASSGMVS